MATNRFLTLVGNVRTLVTAIAESVGAGDANKIVATGADGRLDISLLPAGIGADTALIEAGENLSAGDLVNIFDDTGPKVRLADASDVTRKAHGYVLDNVTAPANAEVYFEGRNDELSGLTPGVTYALSATTPGEVVTLASADSSAGNIIQVVGTAVSATSIDIEIQQPIVIA